MICTINYRKILKLFLIIFLSSINTVIADENAYIVTTVNNDIITNIDIEKEYRYLVALNNDFKKIDTKRALLVAQDSIVREIIKKDELMKYFNLNQENEYLNTVLKNFYTKLNINDEIGFKNYLKQFELTIDDVKYKLKIETIWNELIFERYKNQIDIDENRLKESLQKEILNTDLKINTYLISEILYTGLNKEEMDNKYKLIQESIIEIGFKNTANIYSEADSSKMGGSVGWINESQLSENVKKSLSKLKIGQHTKPIVAGGGFLLLNIDDKKEDKINLDFEEEFKKKLSFEKNRQLNQFSTIYFNKIRQNAKIKNKN